MLSFNDYLNEARAGNHLEMSLADGKTFDKTAIKKYIDVLSANHPAIGDFIFKVTGKTLYIEIMYDEADSKAARKAIDSIHSDMYDAEKAMKIKLENTKNKLLDNENRGFIEYKIV